MLFILFSFATELLETHCEHANQHSTNYTGKFSNHLPAFHMAPLAYLESLADVHFICVVCDVYCELNDYIITQKHTDTLTANNIEEVCDDDIDMTSYEIIKKFTKTLPNQHEHVLHVSKSPPNIVVFPFTACYNSMDTFAIGLYRLHLHWISQVLQA